MITHNTRTASHDALVDTPMPISVHIVFYFSSHIKLYVHSLFYCHLNLRPWY